MKVQRIGGWGGPIHVFPDDAFVKPLAGPFASEAAARCWVVEHVEKGLSPAKLAVWQQVAALLPAPSDFGHELALIGLAAHGIPFEKLTKYIPSPLPARGPDRRHGERRDVPDHRLAAAGEQP